MNGSITATLITPFLSLLYNLLYILLISALVIGFSAVTVLYSIPAGIFIISSCFICFMFGLHFFISSTVVPNFFEILYKVSFFLTLYSVYNCLGSIVTFNSFVSGVMRITEPFFIWVGEIPGLSFKIVSMSTSYLFDIENKVSPSAIVW